jgi:N-acetylneuraminic acid mutarotase
MKPLGVILVLTLGLAVAIGTVACQDLGPGTSEGPATTNAPADISAVTVSTTPSGPASAVAWTQLSPASAPSAREGACMVYDLDRQKLYLFGGYNWTAFLNDTWSFDPSTGDWTQLSPSGTVPPGREYHAMAYDSAAGKVIMFGGVNDSGTLADTWAYDPAADTWEQLHPTNSPGSIVPTARMGHKMVYDGDTGMLIVFGGDTMAVDGQLGDCYALDLTNNQWLDWSLSGDLPPARAHAGMAYSPSDSKVVLFGGYASATDLNDTWGFVPIAHEWSGLGLSAAPSARAYVAMEYYSDSNNEWMVLFGGRSIDDEILADTWVFDPEGTDGWTELHLTGTQPDPRAGHAMAYDSAGGRLYMFGGANEDGLYRDTWAFGPMGF